MTNTETDTGPLEIWLRQENLAVYCTVVHEDESTSSLSIDSLSMRGAQREITGYMIQMGRQPDGRWVDEVDGEQADEAKADETMRRFKAKRG